MSRYQAKTFKALVKDSARTPETDRLDDKPDDPAIMYRMRINAEVAINASKLHNLEEVEYKIEEPPSVMGAPMPEFRGTDSEWNFSETEQEKAERDHKL